MTRGAPCGSASAMANIAPTLSTLRSLWPAPLSSSARTFMRCVKALCRYAVERITRITPSWSAKPVRIALS